MKSSKTVSRPGRGIAVRRAGKMYAALALAVLIGLGWHIAIGHAQSPDNDAAGTTVLTRGPVHEAFAGVVTFNAEAGVVVAKAPPEVIEELPPEERPEGDNVTWIPGYWAWDDERTDYLWVSGTWRALPPGRAWVAGYWGKSPRGYQWTCGYWADAEEKETTYLPAPPATVEVGPNIEAPSDDYGWSPGYWAWYHGRYAWTPGYWAEGRADWDWSPGHYVWTPRGYIFVGGFWDYPVERRGVLFAPVYFESGGYARHGYVYSPTIVIGLDVFSAHLFLRPSYGHYYFGDYYAPSYHEGGFYASFSFGSGHRGYDPIFSHQRWEHRRDHNWERDARSSYENRRDHENARPPHTWAEQRNMNPDSSGARQNHAAFAAPVRQLATRNDGPMKFQPVAKAEREQLSRRGREVQQSREQRRTIETTGGGVPVQKSGATFEPARVRNSQSPIVARPASQMEKNQAPPLAQSSARPESRARRNEAKPEAPVRPSVQDRKIVPPESRRIAPEKRQDPAPVETPAPRPKNPDRKSGNETLPDAGERIRPEPEKRVKEPVLRAPKNPEAANEARNPVMRAPVDRSSPRQIMNEKGAGRQMRNDRAQNPPAPANPPSSPPGRDNSGAGDRSSSAAPDRDRDREKRDRP